MTTPYLNVVVDDPVVRALGTVTPRRIRLTMAMVAAIDKEVRRRKIAGEPHATAHAVTLEATARGLGLDPAQPGVVWRERKRGENLKKYTPEGT